MAKYGNYQKKTASSGPPNTFTARITTPEATRHLANCKIWNGILVQLTSVGRGKKVEIGGMNAYGEGETWEEWEYYAYVPKPYFCKAKFRDNAEQEAAKKLFDSCAKKGDWTACFEQYKHAMFVMGDNGHGYKVEDDEAAKAAALRTGATQINFVSALFGLKIQERLPADLWALVKPYAEYITYEQADDYQEDCIGYPQYNVRDIMGWHYKPDAITALVKSGCAVSYRGEPITSPDEMTGIDAKIDDEHRAYLEKQEARRRRKNELIAQLPKRDAYEYMTESDAKAIKSLPILTFLDWTGANIYGGGTWAHVDENYFYRVDNNGMDGDNWAYNNYETGGAGAIAYRTPLTDQLKQLLAQIYEFENKK